jgi:hypothetical protein
VRISPNRRRKTFDGRHLCMFQVLPGAVKPSIGRRSSIRATPMHVRAFRAALSRIPRFRASHGQAVTRIESRLRPAVCAEGAWGCMPPGIARGVEGVSRERARELLDEVCRRKVGR